MGPKKGGGGQAKQRGNATEEVEETLQAVVCSLYTERPAHWHCRSLDHGTTMADVCFGALRFLPILSKLDSSLLPLRSLVYVVRD